MAFDNITTIDGWSAALKELLDRALTTKEHDDRMNISIELTDYQIASMPPDPTNTDQVAAIQQFDRIAREAAEKVLIDEISEHAQAITGRASDLAAATKAFRAHTEKNERVAEMMKLTPVVRAIKGATDLIDSVKDVRASLGSGEEADKLRARLDRLVKSVQDIRNALERGEADPA
jgi:hypothetical protein